MERRSTEEITKLYQKAKAQIAKGIKVKPACEAVGISANHYYRHKMIEKRREKAERKAAKMAVSTSKRITVEDIPTSQPIAAGRLFVVYGDPVSLSEFVKRHS